MKIEELHKNKFVLIDCISGSKAYGLDLPHSDVDRRGVFYLPKKMFYADSEIYQISNQSNDESYSELGRFFELLMKSNPTIIELLNTPPDKILSRHSFFDRIDRNIYLSKECKHSFAGYAITQVKKARGLKKKILNPLEKERKTVLDFCFVIKEQGSEPLSDFLDANNIDPADCGLAKIPHMHEVYGLYYQEGYEFDGIISGAKANEVSLSSIPKGLMPKAIMSFNKSAYSSYCKEYKEYWEWVEKRNEERYQNTLSHGKNYDSKNMMHTFRLLAMAEEIALEGKVFVHRSDRDFLLKVRAGEFEYEDLLNMAEERIEKMNEAFQKSPLPEMPDKAALQSLLVEFRELLYS